MAVDKPLSLKQLAGFVVDFDVSDLAGSAEPPSGVYAYTVSEAGYKTVAGDLKLAVTLLGIGGRDTWDNISMPTNPNSENVAIQNQSLVTFLRSCGAIPESHTDKNQLDGPWLEANVVNKGGFCWYEAREKDANGAAIEGSYKEITYLTPKTKAQVDAGTLKITRFKKAGGGHATSQSLGSPSALPAAVAAIAPVAVVGVPAPVAVGVVPVAAVASAVPQPPAPVGIAPVALPGVPSFGAPPIAHG